MNLVIAPLKNLTVCLFFCLVSSVGLERRTSNPLVVGSSPTLGTVDWLSLRVLLVIISNYET